MSVNRAGNIYDYFYCLGRQHDTHSCNWRAVRVHTVEQLVVDHYRTVELPPERINEVRDVLKEALATKRTEAEVAETSLTQRIERLTDERHKLLQLHYAEAVPIDLFKQEQERITRELKQARDRLADVSLEFDAIEQNLNQALAFAKDCHAAYESADNNTRRLFNQALFERIYVHNDGAITHDLAAPFKILLDPRLIKELTIKPGKKAKKQADWPDGGVWWTTNENDLEVNEVAGSNFNVLVPPVGLEPTTDCLEGSCSIR